VATRRDAVSVEATAAGGRATGVPGDLAVFVGRLASNNPTPGGGAAAAYAAAMGAAAVAKVVAVSVGKPKYAAYEAELQGHLAHLHALSGRFFALGAEDEAAFAALMAAYRLPRSTDDEKAARAAAIQAGLRGAAAVPLRVLVSCREVLDAAERVAQIGNPSALGDCGAGAALAVAAMRVSLLNVTANVAGLTDGATAMGYREQLRDLYAGIEGREAVLVEAIRRRLAGEEDTE